MENTKTKDKTALVTGAASGLGFEFALLLAEDNYNLILVDINRDRLKETKKYIEKRHAIKISLLVKDLSRLNIADEIFSDTETTIDVLINNAGFGLFGSFINTKWQRESDMLNLHINTTSQLTKLALNQMLKKGQGKILNVSSLAAFQPGPLMSIYYASKAYILSFSQAIANELKGTGITVTVLCPGPTKTRFQEVVANSSSKNKIKINMASPKDVARIGYKAMLAGKEIAIPGLFNKVLAFLPRLMPRNKVTSIVRKFQEMNRVKKLKLNNI